MELRIDPEFQSKVPPLTDEEFQQLESNILADGMVINPIIVWNGVIVDGHNRYRIIGKYPHIPFTTCEKGFANRHEAIAWICKNQLGRRNLTFEQKKYLIGKQYEAEKEAHGGDRKSLDAKSSGQNAHLISDKKTAERIAEENGINEKTVRRAEQYSKSVDLVDEAEPGLRTEILSGKIKATDKEIHALASAAPEERQELLTELRLPPKERKEKLQQIAADMLTAKSRGTADDMLYELEDALESMIFRWSMCLGNNADYFGSEEHRTKIDQLAHNGLNFLNRILKGEIPQ